MSLSLLLSLLSLLSLVSAQSVPNAPTERLPQYGSHCGDGYGMPGTCWKDALDRVCYRHDRCFERRGLLSCECQKEAVAGVTAADCSTSPTPGACETYRWRMEKLFKIAPCRCKTGYYGVVYFPHTCSIYTAQTGLADAPGQCRALGQMGGGLGASAAGAVGGGFFQGPRAGGGKATVVQWNRNDNIENYFGVPVATRDSSLRALLDVIPKLWNAETRLNQYRGAKFSQRDIAAQVNLVGGRRMKNCKLVRDRHPGSYAAVAGNCT